MCTGTQKCNVCKEEKSLSNFYFRSDTKKHKRRCKRCCIDEKNIDRSSGLKTCKHCGEEKPYSEYQKAGGGNWLQPYCKGCDKKRKKQWEELNKDELRVKRNKHYIEKVKPFYVKKGRKYISEEEKRNKLIAYRNRPDVKRKKAECDRRYRQNNQISLKKRKKEYYDLNGLQQAKDWQKKMMNDIGFRIKKNLRGRIYVALKRGVKSEPTMRLLGCGIDFFKQYFESLFTDGMSWCKYLEGGIHIDHIIPCKYFDLTDPEQQKKCFHYTNLQPLWSIDNLRKGVSLPENIKAA